MEDYNEFVSFDILNDKVDVLCTETVYGTNVVVEIENNFHYIGLIQEHIKSGRMASDIDMKPNLEFAILAWQEYFGKNLSETELLFVVNASIKFSSEE